LEYLLLLAVFVLGYFVSWLQWYQPEKEKVDQLMGKASGQDLPQHQNSYWKFEGPKLQKRVLDLEMQLEQLRSKTLWRQD
jgi:hypothetical protein